MKRSHFRTALAALLTIVILTACFTPAHALSVPYTPSSYYSASSYYTALKAVQLTGNQRADIIAVALSQRGYHEGNSVRDLGGGNQRGTCNYTEYCYWYGRNVLGNSGGYYGAWCAMFIAWCASMARIPASIISRACYAHAGNSNPYFFNNLTFHSRGSYTPQPGDLIFYDWPDVPGTWNHVGIVHYVDSGCVHTIEGNTSAEAVVLRSLSLSNSTIIGYGVPHYSGSSSSSSSSDDPSSYPVPTRVLSLGCTGQDVRWLQAALKKLGYSLLIDGNFGTNTKNAVVHFQQSCGLTADGKCGPATRQAIINRLGASGSGGSGSGSSSSDPNDPASYPVPTRVLSLGCTGQDVRWLQAALKKLGYSLLIDGNFGPNTKNAVVRFQQSRGLTADGKCGPVTRQAIISSLNTLH